jgi:predicted transcriptional regulator
MNDSPQEAVVLMSIKPQYVKAINEGNKLIEFRRKKFTKTIKYILVYETAPTKTLVGYIEVKSIEIETPDVMWRKYSKIGVITEEDYFNYYNGSDVAIGILIDKFISFVNPINIKEFKIIPPQSFRYIAFDLFCKIVNIEEPAHV